MRPAIEARDLVFTRGGQRILDGASLAIEPASIASLQGPSGSGKSTLLRLMATLAEPDSGQVLLGGVDAQKIPPREFRKRVAWVPQQPPMFEGTVADNLEAGPSFRGARLGSGALSGLLERVGLPAQFVERDARGLSGGERQRVALARALANEPEVLLLDEPTSALDPVAAGHIVELVRSLARGGLSVLVVTHIEEHARALGGTRHRCEAGRVFPGAPKP
jgi:putative ABC transport system ATP-binding protein